MITIERGAAGAKARRPGGGFEGHRSGARWERGGLWRAQAEGHHSPVPEDVDLTLGGTRGAVLLTSIMQGSNTRSVLLKDHLGMYFL